MFSSAHADDIGDLIQNSVVKACDQINKKKSGCVLQKATKPAAVKDDNAADRASTSNTDTSSPAPANPTDVAAAVGATLSRCDSQRADLPPTAPLSNSSEQNMDLSTLTPAEAQQVFQFVSRQKSRYGLSGNYVADRVCAQRAQLVAYDLQQVCKVKSAKIFVQPSRSWLTLGLGRNDLQVDANDKHYRWDNFHVANIVMVHDGAGDEPYVIDPLLFQQPVPLKQWEALVKKSDPSASSTLTSGSVYLLNEASEDDPSRPVFPGKAEQDMSEAKALAQRLRR